MRETYYGALGAPRCVVRVIAVLLVVIPFSGCIELFQQEVAEEEAEAAPSVAFADDESGDRMTVMRTPTDVPWADFTVTGNRPAYVRLNDGPIRSFSPTNPTTVGIADVQAGDKLDFCLPRPGSLEVRLLHTPSDTVKHAFSFASISTHDWCD